MKTISGRVVESKFDGSSLVCKTENGCLRVRAYSPSIINIRYEIDGYQVPEHLEKARDYLVETSGEDDLTVSVSCETGSPSLSIGDVSVTVSLEDSNITVCKGSRIVHGGRLGNSDTVISHSQFRLIGKESDLFGRFSFPLEDDDSFYGLGDKSGDPDRRGKRFRMYNRDSLGYDAEYSDPLYKSVPFFMKHNRASSVLVGLYFPETLIKAFDFGKESPFFYSAEVSGGPFEYFVIVGDDYKSILSDYCSLTGKPAFPPLFSFGYLGSSMNYMEAWDARKRILKFFEDTERYQLPCEGMYGSSGYLKADDGKRYSFFWNRRKFPDPKTFFGNLAERGYHITLNIKPGILLTHPWYPELLEKGYFVKGEDGKPLVEFFWGGDASFIDFDNPAAKAWWKEKLCEAYLDYGVEGIWNDNNEFELEDTSQKAFETRTLYPVKMAETAYETCVEREPGKRPWIYSRSGYSRLQKFARTWTGDNTSLFKTLRYNQYQGLSLGLSGMPFFGHDLGGFYGNEPSTELLVRSCQSAVFQPRFVIHSWRENDEPTEPWKDPEAFPLIRTALEDHYRHMPYIYNVAYQASVSGTPMDRPLFLEYPSDGKIKTDMEESLFGPSVLKTLVVNEGQTSVSVYFPAGDDWYCPLDKKVYRGGTTVGFDAPLEKYWYFYKVGGVIPQSPVCGKLRTAFFDEVSFFVLPQDGRTEYLYFEDDGNLKINWNSFNTWKIVTEYSEAGKTGTVKLELNHCGRPDTLSGRAFSLALPNGFAGGRRMELNKETEFNIPISGGCIFE